MRVILEVKGKDGLVEMGVDETAADKAANRSMRAFA